EGHVDRLAHVPHASGRFQHSDNRDGTRQPGGRRSERRGRNIHHDCRACDCERDFRRHGRAHPAGSVHAGTSEDGAGRSNLATSLGHPCFPAVTARIEYARMWIVRVALKRPYTFVVMALLILLVGPLTILRTPTDIFPNINIPIVAVVWNFSGLSAEEMSTRIVVSFERVLTISVNDIEHIESQSLNGVGVVKIFFQPTVRIALAMAQVSC